VRLTVIGCGYVGLVTGACLAAAGHEVICTDIDEKRIDQLKAGKVPIYEEHLDRKCLRRAVAEKKISYTSNAGEAIPCRVTSFSFCVGTPPKESGEGRPFRHRPRRSPSRHRGTLSETCGREEHRPRAHRCAASESSGRLFPGSGPKFQVASNPEFLREGTAVGDFFHPDRIVVGVEDTASAAKLREIYQPILERKFHCPIHAGGCPKEPAGVLLRHQPSTAPN